MNNSWKVWMKNCMKTVFSLNSNNFIAYRTIHLTQSLAISLYFNSVFMCFAFFPKTFEGCLSVAYSENNKLKMQFSWILLVWLVKPLKAFALSFVPKKKFLIPLCQTDSKYLYLLLCSVLSTQFHFALH